MPLVVENLALWLLLALLSFFRHLSQVCLLGHCILHAPYEWLTVQPHLYSRPKDCIVEVLHMPSHMSLKGLGANESIQWWL